MSDKPQFFHFSKDRDEIEYIFDRRNRDKFRSMGVKMRREGPENLVFTGDSTEVLEKAAHELDQIRGRFFKPITKKVVVTKDQVGYFRGRESKHFEQVKEKTYVDNVYFNNIFDKNDIEMVQIVVYGSRPSVDKFMSEVLRSVSSLTQKQLGFEMPSEEELKEARAAARTAREQHESPAADPEDEDGDKPVPGISKDTWKKVKSKERKKKPKLPPSGEVDEDETVDDDDD